MKKSLLFIAMNLLLGSYHLTAQVVAFSDDYESYETGTNLTSQGYAVWEGVATVTDEATSGSAPANGTKYVLCQPGGNNFYLRKPLTLEVGKSYTFEVMTKTPAGNNYRVVAHIGTRNVQTPLLKNKDWAKTSLDFTVAAGEENCIFWIYSYPKTAVHVDDFIIKEQSATAISETGAFSGLTVQYSAESVRITGVTPFAGYQLFSLGGQVISSAEAVNSDELSINLSGLAKGLYLISVTDVNGRVYTEKVVRK